MLDIYIVECLTILIKHSRWNALKSLVSYQISCCGKDTILFRDITVDFVRGYLSYIQSGSYQYSRSRNRLKLKSLSPWSINTYASCLKKVINCAIDANRLSADVMRGFRKFKAGVVHKQPYTLSIDELRALLNTARSDEVVILS